MNFFYRLLKIIERKNEDVPRTLKVSIFYYSYHQNTEGEERAADHIENIIGQYEEGDPPNEKHSVH